MPGRLPIVVLIISFCIGCTSDEITTRWIPKEQAPSMVPGAAPASESHREVEWTVPSRWTEQPASGMRVGSFLFNGPDKQTADISVIQLSGEAGGDVANINRWRGQIGLPALTDQESKRPGEMIKPAGRNMLLVDFENKGQRLVAAIYRAGESTWFFKMTGGTSAVGAAKPDFLKLLESLRFHQHEHE